SPQDRGRGPPAAGAGHEHPGAAESLGGRLRPTGRRRPQRLGRHLAAHTRSHQPRAALARSRRAETTHGGGGTRAARAARRLSRVYRPRRVDRRAAAPAGAGARGRPGPRQARARNLETLVTMNDTIALDWASPQVRSILGDLLDGGELSVADGIALTEVAGRDFAALTLVADEMRRRQVGDVVTYVVNRNINFTNVCIKHCTFCAFSRDHREEEGYFLPMDEVVRRAIEAWEMGATEVCIQAGLPPKLEGSYYLDLCRAIMAAIPEYLTALKAAGLGTLPGTSAEVLDQEIRDVIARGRITVEQWVEVITSAH